MLSGNVTIDGSSTVYPIMEALAEELQAAHRKQLCESTAMEVDLLATLTRPNPMDAFTALAIQIFNWSSRPQEEFRQLAAAGIIVLLVLLLGMNVLAVFIRHCYGKRVQG